MERTGLVGWRGMVGSVLLERMAAEGDFELIEPVFFSTSDKGGKAPPHAKNETKLLDAHDIAEIQGRRVAKLTFLAQGNGPAALAHVYVLPATHFALPASRRMSLRISGPPSPKSIETSRSSSAPWRRRFPTH